MFHKDWISRSKVEVGDYTDITQAAWKSHKVKKSKAIPVTHRKGP
jgi:hypothetical protein